MQFVREEYERCLALAARPDLAPEMYGISGAAEVSKYYQYRAEALGFVLDGIAQGKT